MSAIMMEVPASAGLDGDLSFLPKAKFSSGGSGSFRSQIKNAASAAKFAGYGSDSTSDTLATWKAANAIIADYGLDEVFRGITQLLERHNAITAELLSDFCDVTTDRLRRIGNGVLPLQMQDVDQAGLPVAQKLTAGATLGFPMTRKAIGLQWDADFFTQATTIELAAQMEGLLTADTRKIQLDIKKAIFTPTNSNFYDVLVDNVFLPVKALSNADGGATPAGGIPPGPNGEVFNATTHNHYIYPGSGNGDTLAAYATKNFSGTTGVFAWNNGANAAQIAWDVQTMQDNVTEHYNGNGKGMVYANRTEEAYLRSMPGFTALVDLVRVEPNIVVDRSKGQLAVNDLFNRHIGDYRGFEVWIKPYMPPGYLFAFFKDSGDFEPPLAIRVPMKSPAGASAGGAATLMGGDLRQVNPFGQVFPMYAQAFDRRYGIGCWNRQNGCAMSVYALSYSAPTFSYP